MKVCKDCKFFHIARLGEPNQKFECRKYAPRVIHGAGTGWADQNWAFINNPIEDWCGEFEEAQDELAQN